MRRLVLASLVVVVALAAGISTAGADTPTSVTATFTGNFGASLIYGSGTIVTGSVTGAGGTPSGTITVTEGASSLGSAAVAVDGSYVLTLPLLGPGAHSITVSYGGDGTFSAGQVTSSIDIGRADPAISVSGPDEVFAGQTADYTVAVSRGQFTFPAADAPTGTVTAHAAGVGGTVFATAPLTAGIAHLSVPSSAAPNPVAFDYSGDANYNIASTSKSLSGPISYNLTLTEADAHGCTATQQPGPCVTPVPGYPMILVVVLAPSAGQPEPPQGVQPTGTVTFVDETAGVGIGSATVSNGLAFGVAFFGTPGQHVVRATYSGDTNFTAVSSFGGDLVVTVIDADHLQRYVNWVYLDLLERDGDPGGIAYWTGLLENGTSRAATSWSLVNTNEFRSNTISDMYDQFLERRTDSGGLNYWVGRIGTGMTFEQFQSLLIASDEYYAKPTKGNGNDTTFVESMYKDVLDRQIDPAGRQYFLNLLAKGTPRSQVVAAVVYSTEHLQTTVDRYYQHFLGRESDRGGRDYWVSQLQRGARDELIIALIIGSDEYFSIT